MCSQLKLCYCIPSASEFMVVMFFLCDIDEHLLDLYTYMILFSIVVSVVGGDGVACIPPPFYSLSKRLGGEPSYPATISMGIETEMLWS